MEEDYLPLPYDEANAEDYAALFNEPGGGGVVTPAPDNRELIDALIRSLVGMPSSAQPQYGFSPPSYSVESVKAAAEEVPVKPRPVSRSRFRGIGYGQPVSKVPMGLDISGKFRPFGRYQYGFIDEFGQFHPNEYPSGVFTTGAFPVSM